MAGGPPCRPWLLLFAADRGKHEGRLLALPARFAIAAVAFSTTTAAAIAAEASAISAKATSAAAAVLARFGFVDFQRTTADFFAIEQLNGCIGFFGRGHFHKGEAARTTRHAIFDDAR